jgi:RHS repeat-associated protein
MTDSAGTVVWAADYLPFGQADVTVAAVENNLRFAGQYYDNETGLHYNYWRYYDPKVGRYLRADPIGLEGGANLYSYVLNNPINKSDPLGLCSKDCPYCPGGAWNSFSLVAVSAFWGGGGTLARTTYTCKSNGKKCSGTAICFGGGAIGAVGIGVDAGGFIGAERGVTDTYCPSDFENFSSGIYITAGPVSETHTGNSSNIGLSKSWGLGIAYVTCINTLVICE